MLRVSMVVALVSGTWCSGSRSPPAPSSREGLVAWDPIPFRTPLGTPYGVSIVLAAADLVTTAVLLKERATHVDRGRPVPAGMAPTVAR